MACYSFACAVNARMKNASSVCSDTLLRTATLTTSRTFSLAEHSVYTSMQHHALCTAYLYCCCMTAAAQQALRRSGGIEQAPRRGVMRLSICCDRHTPFITIHCCYDRSACTCTVANLHAAALHCIARLKASIRTHAHVCTRVQQHCSTLSANMTVYAPFITVALPLPSGLADPHSTLCSQGPTVSYKRVWHLLQHMFEQCDTTVHRDSSSVCKGSCMLNNCSVHRSAECSVDCSVDCSAQTNKLLQGDELTHTSAEQLDGAIRYLTELTKKALHRRANAANNQGTLQQKPIRAAPSVCIQYITSLQRHCATANAAILAGTTHACYLSSSVSVLQCLVVHADCSPAHTASL
eukprot:7569-Heterococcus_DN1.PRE.5